MSYKSDVVMNAKARTETGKGVAGRLRREGEVPVTVYGGDSPAASGTINRHAFAAHIRAHGRAALFNLDLDGTTAPVKIADLQIDPVKSTVTHVDFVRLSLTEKSEFVVPIKISGEAQGVKLGGGILDVILHSLKIRCLPTDLPDYINVDVTNLAVGGNISVKDLDLPEGVETRTLATQTVATVVAPGAGDEPVAAAPAEPEVAKKGKEAAKK